VHKGVRIRENARFCHFPFNLHYGHLKIISLSELLWPACRKLLLVLTRSQLFWHNKFSNHSTFFCWLFFPQNRNRGISFQYWMCGKGHLNRFGLNNPRAMTSICAAEVITRRKHEKHREHPPAYIIHLWKPKSI